MACAAKIGMGAEMSARSVVLVVEDEPLVRMGAADLVIEAGFEAMEAANAIDALALLEAFPEIAIVFTDIEMAGVFDGLALAVLVSQRWPECRVIVTSGQVLPSADQLPQGALFLAKPYRQEHLVAALHNREP